MAATVCVTAEEESELQQQLLSSASRDTNHLICPNVSLQISCRHPACCSAAVQTRWDPAGNTAGVGLGAGAGGGGGGRIEGGIGGVDWFGFEPHGPDLTLIGHVGGPTGFTGGTSSD